MTPTLTFAEEAQAIPEITATSRTLTRLQIFHLGHLLSLSLAGNFFTTTTLYRTELELRPVLLSVLINEQRLPMQARIRITGTGVVFEIPDHLFLDTTPAQSMLIKRLILDADPNNQSITPSIVTDRGTTTLPPMQNPTRAQREWPLGLPGRPRQVVLDCDTTLINALYEAELHLYVPNNSQRNAG